MPKEETPKKKTQKPEDVVLVHGRTDDGEGHVVLRKRGETLSLGEMRPMREGRPITGDLVRLTPREGVPNVADVEVLHAAASTESGRAGPAQVSSDAYRAGWSAIFGEKKPARKGPALSN